MLTIDKCIRTFDDLLEKISSINSSYNDKLENNPDRESVENERKIELFGEFNKTKIDFFDSLNLSLLSGEYIIEKFNEHLQTIESKLSATAENDLISNDSEITDLFYSKIQKQYSAAIQQYKYLRKNIHNSISNKKRYLFNVVDQNSFFNNSFSDDSFSVFAVNVQVVLADHSLSIKKDSIKWLLILKNKLEDLKSRKTNIQYVDLIADKTDFLIKKALLRLERDKENYFYAINLQDKELAQENINTDIYKCFSNKLDLQYTETRNNSNLNSEIELIFNKINSESLLSYSDFHLIIKHYKDDNFNLQQLNKLIILFDSFYHGKLKESTLSAFDRNALNVCRNYIYNNKLSLLIDQKKENLLNDIDNFYENLLIIQRETNITNYFPAYKYSVFLIDLLKIHFSPTNNSIINPDEIIKKLKHSIKRYSESTEKCYDSNFQAYQLCFDECCFKHEYKGENIRLFLSSSFVLPINYLELEVNLSSLKQELMKYETIYEIHKSIETEKNEISNIKRQFESSDKKHIELLSIFAAIVLFVAGNIQLFKEVNSFKDSILFTIGFAYSLGSFVILIWLITRDYKIKISWLHKTLLAMYILITIFILLQLLVTDPIF